MTQELYTKKNLHSIYKKEIDEINEISFQISEKINELGKKVTKDNSESWMWEISMLEEVIDKNEILRNTLETFAENSIQEGSI